MLNNTRHQLAGLFLTGLIALSPASPEPGISAAPQPGIPAALRPEIEKAFHTVNPKSDLKTTMSFLADDLLEGRQPGTRGFALASRYIQTQFMALGLIPGVNGSYVQPVLLKKGVTLESGSSLRLGGDNPADTGNNRSKPLIYGKDFLLSPNLLNPVSEVSAPLVFTGFGIYAPELNYDDYQNTDVKGKIVVFLSQAPASFPSNERAYFSSATTKYAEAVKRGAIGVITLSLPGGQRSSWEAAVQRARQGSFRWADSTGRAQETYEQLKVIASLNPDESESLFSFSGKTWASVANNAQTGHPQSFPLNRTASLKVSTTVSDIRSSNLVGVIPGSDPVLKNQYVVYAAHLDHFGIGAPIKGDSIFYNGAHDNASTV